MKNRDKHNLTRKTCYSWESSSQFNLRCNVYPSIKWLSFKICYLGDVKQKVYTKGSQLLRT